MKCDKTAIRLTKTGIVVDFIKEPMISSPFEDEVKFREIKLRLELSAWEYVRLLCLLVTIIPSLATSMPKKIWKSFTSIKIIKKFYREQSAIWKEFEDAIK